MSNESKLPSTDDEALADRDNLRASRDQLAVTVAELQTDPHAQAERPHRLQECVSSFLAAFPDLARSFATPVQQRALQALRDEVAGDQDGED